MYVALHTEVLKLLISLAFTYDFIVCISELNFAFKLLIIISSTKPELTGTMLTSEVNILVRNFYFE